MSFPVLGFWFLLVLVLYFWWTLSRKIAEVEAKLPDLGGGGRPPCCDELEARIDKIVVWLKKQYTFNQAIDDAICALEKMASDKDFDSWDNTDSNCGHDPGGGRVPPPEPDPNF